MPKRTNRSYVYTPLMRWEPLPVEGSTGHAWVKGLSKDDETGARTAMIKYDPGFRAPKTKSEWPIDMFVLEGGMTSGNRTYQKGTFHYRPAGAEIGPIETTTGITRIIFTAEERGKSSPDEVFIQDTELQEWTKSYSDPTGTKRKLKDLRQDTIAGITMLIHSSFLPGLRAIENEMHVHDHIEEYYVLMGEFHDYLEDVDAHVRSVEGMYFYRAPFESYHGDTTSVITPSRVLVRRGWVGKADTFYDNITEHTPDKFPVKPLDFKE